MTDVVDKATRSRMMSGIRSKDTKPELIVRKYLHAQGFRFRLNVNSLPGRPDLVLPRWRTVVFVHGCFWHRHAGCRFTYTPKSRTEFWQKKFEQNIQRDAAAVLALKKLGWHVIVLWECTLKNNGCQPTLAELAVKIRERLGNEHNND
ncbi:MAG: very short patch repair endonuclease [Comamonadaceae bacterium PBBC1]|nr:MAG: very short patch repair endonuclease [Comamonadaceae bacterium PBBC1]